MAVEKGYNGVPYTVQYEIRLFDSLEKVHTSKYDSIALYVVPGIYLG